MMGLKLLAVLVALLPAIYAHVDITIVAADRKEDSSAVSSGSSVDIISDMEMKTYQMSNENLKVAVEKYFGKRPNDVFVKSPTPWGDLYATYGWQQVTRSFAPHSTRIIYHKSEEELILTNYFTNNSSQPVEYTVSLEKSVNNVLRSKWQKNGNLTIGEKLQYNIGIKYSSKNKYFQVSYTSRWGENVKKQATVMIGSKNVLIKLQPNQEVSAELYAVKGSITVRSDYRGVLAGLVAVNYSKPYQGHHFWGLPVNSVMTAGNLPKINRSSEIILLNYYSGSHIVVKDKKTSKVLYTIPCPLEY
jgi:hypothetical protein